MWHERNDEMLTFYKEFLGEQARLNLYSCTDRSEYELNMAMIKAQFLGGLVGRCEFEVGCIPKETPDRPHGKVLPDFDETNCQYKTELSIPYFEKSFNIKVECNKMTTQFDAKFVKGSFEENFATGGYHGTVEIQGRVGSDKERYGPIQLSTEVKAGAGIEFTEGGIQDVFVTAKAGVKAQMGDVSSSLGSIEAKISVITGSTSLNGGGALKAISIK
jgi:hypothetical protein